MEFLATNNDANGQAEMTFTAFGTDTDSVACSALCSVLCAVVLVVPKNSVLQHTQHGSQVVSWTEVRNTKASLWSLLSCPQT